MGTPQNLTGHVRNGERQVPLPKDFVKIIEKSQNLLRGICGALTNSSYQYGCSFNRTYLFLRDNGSFRFAAAIAPHHGDEWGQRCALVDTLEEQHGKTPAFFQGLAEQNMENLITASSGPGLENLCISANGNNPLADCIATKQCGALTNAGSWDGDFSSLAQLLGLEHFATVPILSSTGEVIGVVLADRRFEVDKKRRAISDEDLMQLLTASLPLGPLLENAVLSYREMMLQQQRVDELRAAHEIANILDPHELMVAVVGHVAEKTGGTARIWKTNAGHNHATCIVSSLPGDTTLGKKIRKDYREPGKLALFRCIDKGAPETINDPLHDESADPATSSNRPFCHSPLTAGKVVDGVRVQEAFGTLLFSCEGPITQELIDYVSQFASLIAVHMENSIVYDRIRKLNEMLLSLIGALADTLRNRIMSIGASAKRIKKIIAGEAPSFDSISHFNEGVIKDSDRMETTNEEVLRLMDEMRGADKKYNPYDIVPVQVQPLVEEAAAPFLEQLKKDGGGRKLFFDNAPGLAALADEGRAKSIISAVIHNALKHTTGDVLVTAAPFEEAGAKFVEVSVVDNGPGVSDTEKIFWPSESPKESEKICISLATRRAQARNMGGELYVENEEAEAGGGAAFTLRLPLAEQN